MVATSTLTSGETDLQGETTRFEEKKEEIASKLKNIVALRAL